MQDRHILCNLLAPLANFASSFPNLFKDRGLLQSLGSINCKCAKIVTKHWVPRLLSGGTVAADNISILSRARVLAIGGTFVEGLEQPFAFLFKDRCLFVVH